MRVVMLTDDVQIDRRILLEAESLQGRGHEVILLAEAGAGLEGYEWLDRVKVERVQHPNLSESEKLIFHISSLVSGIFSRLSAGVLKVIGLISIGVSKGFSLAIVLNQHAANFILRLFRGVRRIPLYESSLVDRVFFYDADVVHAHDLPRLRVGAMAKKKLRVPLVYDAHELYSEIATLTPRQKKLLSRREKRYINAADAVITVNGYIADEFMKRYKIKRPKVILNATKWPSGIDLPRRFDKFRERFAIPKDARIVLFQGWMSATRGLQPLVRAMKFVPDFVHLVFMGYGEGVDALKKITRLELNLEKRIHFMEAVPQKDLLEWTASADVGIIPYQPVDLNNYFSSPNKLFEYIQAELPVIANDLPFLRAVVGGEGFGIVCKLETVDDFASAINKVFCDGEDRLRCYKENLRKKKKKYSWENEEKKLFEIYDSFYLLQ